MNLINVIPDQPTPEELKAYEDRLKREKERRGKLAQAKAAFAKLSIADQDTLIKANELVRRLKGQACPACGLPRMLSAWLLSRWVKRGRV